MNNRYWSQLAAKSALTSEEAQRPLLDKQQQWLMSCITHHQHCAYGQKYQFSSITGIADYQQHVPIVDYEELSPWINQIAAGNHDRLFMGLPVAFEKTGGSQSGGKLIPYTAEGLMDFRLALLTWFSTLITAHHITQGSAYLALSPAVNQSQSTDSGIPIGGGDALYLGDEILQIFAHLSAVPFSVGQVTNLNDWQLLTLYYLITHPDLRLISIWSPTFLLQLLDAIPIHQQNLMVLLTQGGQIAKHDLPPDANAKTNLEKYLSHPNTRTLWPDLAVISCWADASSKSVAEQLQQRFPEVYLQPKGLLATEYITTIPNQDNLPVLCAGSNFYEFREYLGNEGVGQIYLADQLIAGHHYQLIVTTNSGLYRYQTGDIVHCLGYQGELPQLQFMGRNGIVSDLVGEKLTEVFVNQCLAGLKGFAALCASEDPLGYYLIIDKSYWLDNQSEILSIEQKLCDNPQYAYARQLTQLAPLVILSVEQPAQRYIDWRYHQGKRLGDIKVPSLIVDDEWRRVFATPLSIPF